MKVLCNYRIQTENKEEEDEVVNDKKNTITPLGVANGVSETLRDGETSVFSREPETFWLFKLRHRGFKVF